MIFASYVVLISIVCMIIALGYQKGAPILFCLITLMLSSSYLAFGALGFIPTIDVRWNH